MNKEKIIIVSGGFDPVHVGHIRYFQDANNMWKVIIALNSDKRLSKKKGKSFMNRDERKEILLEMKSISDVIAFDDEDWTACDGIQKVYNFYSWSWNKIIFVKWWDRTAWNTPEQDLCKELWINVIFWVWWKDKPQSSSWLLKDWEKK